MLVIEPLFPQSSLSTVESLALGAMQRLMPSLSPTQTPQTVGVELRGANAELFSVTDDEVLLDGPAGTGKTLAMLWRMHLCAHNQPGFRGLILRKTHVSLTSTTLVTFRNHVLAREDFGAIFFGGNKQEPAAYRYPNGSVIVVGGMDNPNKVLSSDYDMVLVNEATELTEDQWETVVGRLRNFQLPFQQIIGDTNPQAPTHWLNQRANRGVTRRLISTHKDNPRWWDARRGRWTAEGASYMQRLERLTGTRYKRFVLGQWVATEGQVYETFNPAVHVLSPENPITEAAYDRLRFGWYIGGVDWGWTNPGVLQVWGVDDDDRLYLVAEHYHTQRSVEGWWVERAKEMQEAFGVQRWVCDPSEPANIRAFQQAGLPAVSAMNDVLPGISAVQERLAPTDGGIPRLYLFPGALQQADVELQDDKRPWSTEQEFPEYVWPQDGRGQVKRDRPLDVNNHGMDVMRYVVAELDVRGMMTTLHPALVSAWTDLPG